MIVWNRYIKIIIIKKMLHTMKSYYFILIFLSFLEGPSLHMRIYIICVPINSP